jgi:hypothetical protein
MFAWVARHLSLTNQVWTTVVRSLRTEFRGEFSVVLQNAINISFTHNCSKTKKSFIIKTLGFYVIMPHVSAVTVIIRQVRRKNIERKVNSNHEIFKNKLLIKIKIAFTILHRCCNIPVFVDVVSRLFGMTFCQEPG